MENIYTSWMAQHLISWVRDLPGTGDTAFPSIVQTGEHEFLLANYGSPLRATRWSWIQGQLGKTGQSVSEWLFGR